MNNDNILAESCDIVKLAELLKPQDESSEEEEDDVPGAGLHKMGPGDICPKKPKPIRKPTVVKGEGKQADEILEYEEMLRGEDDKDVLDSRNTPEYSISYKQAITTGDLYLQMGLKTAATSSCEDMIILIKLPGESMATVDLHVTPDNLLLEGKYHLLRLPLPQKVNPDHSNAAFETDAEQLRLTLRMEREFDFVNF